MIEKRDYAREQRRALANALRLAKEGVLSLEECELVASMRSDPVDDKLAERLHRVLGKLARASGNIAEAVNLCGYYFEVARSKRSSRA